MNNKENREYISCLHLMENIQLCRLEEIVRIRKILSQCPNSLFKYKKIDKHVFDMLRNKYAYLSPVKKLDDPYDCLSDFDTSQIMDSGNKTITDQFLNHIIKEMKNVHLSEKQLWLVKEYKSAFKPGDDFETDRVHETLKNEGFSENIINDAIAQYKNLVNLSNTYESTGTFDQFEKILMNPEEAIGVCSLSEINNNKVMWSLYGKEYKGCCIEYRFKLDKRPPRFLLPVIYSREANNNFTEKVFDTLYAELNRHMPKDIFHSDKGIGAVGAIYELFCTKDIDWKFQKEWRLVGGAKDKFHDVEICSIYLGFNVTKTNEEKMIRYAKRYGFNLFKMKSPDGKKRIRFKKII